MNCSDCGAEIPQGGFYCGSCGRPVGFQPTDVATMEEDPDLSEVPQPTASREIPLESPRVEKSYRTRVSGKALCSMCMGAFPETVLTVVDGRPYCPDCSPLVGQRREPEHPETSEQSAMPADDYSSPSTLLFREEKKSGGGARGVIAVLLLVILAGGGFVAFGLLGGDRIDALMSGLDTGRSDAYLLAQTYLPGESLFYNVSAKIKGDGSVSGLPLMGGGGDLAMDMKLFTGIGVEALSVDEQGNAELRISTRKLDLDGTVSFGGRTMPLSGLPIPNSATHAGESAVVKLDPFGDPVGDQPDEGGLSEIFTGQLGETPRHHLKVGDTWSATIPFSQAAGQSLPPGVSLNGLSFGLTCRVEGFKRYAGRDCMVISMKGDLEGGDSIPLPIMGEMQCDMGLKGVLFFDVSVGRVVKIAVDIDLEMGAASDAGGIDLDARMEFDLDLQ